MKSPLPLLLLLLAANAAFSQGVKVNYTINEECGIAKSVEFHLDHSALTGRKVTSWISFGNSRIEAQPNDTVEQLQDCGSGTYFSALVKFDLGPDTIVRFGFLGTVCPNFFKPQIGFLDSASQLAQVEFVFNDSTLPAYRYQKVFINTIKVADVQGIERQQLADSITRFSKNKKLGRGRTINLEPGKYEVQYELKATYNSESCIFQRQWHFHIGHQSRFSIRKNRRDRRVLDTLSDTAIYKMNYGIVDEVFYWDKKGRSYCSLINWTDNPTCIDTNIFFVDPDSNVARLRWSRYTPSYKRPKISEDVYYDYDSDGVIDFKSSAIRRDVKRKYIWNHHYHPFYVVNPYHTLPENLSDSIKMTIWSKDSIGQWIKSEPSIDLCADFVRKDTLTFNHLQNTVTVKKGINYSLNIKIYTHKIAGDDTTKLFYKTLALSLLQKELTIHLNENMDYIIETVSDDYRCDKLRHHVLSSPVGIDPIDLSKKVRVNPNLSSSRVGIKTSDNIKLRGWTVLDLSGKALIQKTSLSGNISNIDVTSLAQGTYLLQIETDKGVLNERITKL